MPQMAPIWWSALFIMFSLSFLSIMFIVYFQKEPIPLMKNQITSNIIAYNWKW